MNIVKLALLDTGTYDQMYLRPYEISDNKRSLLHIQQATNNGQNITSTTLSGVAGSVVRPQADTVAPITISNGWGQRRYRFFMEIHEQDMVGGMTVQYLTGYTDHPGVSMQGHIDPNMRFYVATTIRMKCLQMMGPTGVVNQLSVADSSHVMNHQEIPGVNFFPGSQSLALQRPQDICNTAQTQQYRRVSNQFFDPRGGFAQENIRLSRRSNSIAPKYLSDVLKAGVASLSQADEGSSEAEIWGNAAGLIRENIYSQDNALFKLHRMTSYREGDSFTYSELKTLCPHLDNVTKYIPVMTMSQQLSGNAGTPFLGTYTAGEYDGWRGNNKQTVWATIISNAVPALMMESMIKEANFTIHNHTHSGEITFNYNSVPIMLGTNLQSEKLVDSFAFRMVSEIIRDLLAGDPIPFMINGYFDIIGESRVEIGIGSEPPYPFATPTFADSLFNPVLTVGTQAVEKLSDNLSFFAENLQSGTMSGHAPPVLDTVSSFSSVVGKQMPSNHVAQGNFDATPFSL